MFHSDQGCQFTSYTFRRLLKQLGITQSFSAPGNSYNNSVSEAFFSHFKREELYRREYQSEKEFCNNVNKYISFYNEIRPHKTIGYKTPNALEKNYYKQNNIGQEGSEMQFFNFAIIFFVFSKTKPDYLKNKQKENAQYIGAFYVFDTRISDSPVFLFLKTHASHL